MADAKKKLPQLSENPEKRSGRYHAACRNSDGIPQKERFTRDRRESEVLYAQWIAANYGPNGYLLAEPIQAPLKVVASDGPCHAHSSMLTNLPHIVDAYGYICRLLGWSGP